MLIFIQIPYKVIGLDFQKYKLYRSEDFLDDEQFARWVHKPDDSMLSNFWESLIRVYPEKIEEIIIAKNKLLQFQGTFQPLTTNEIENLWSKINITITTN